MRLLHTLSLTLHEFHGDSIPQYAILSHTWEDEEVSFHDLQSGQCKIMKGYTKIKNCCAHAASENWTFVWIDTCCIDKTSSAELSESINSMFRWYHEAEVCYAYLADVDDEMEPPNKLRSDFRGSKWFTRGWTLQELLAPHEVVFLNKKWREIGTKGRLNKVISQISGINDLHDFSNACIAQKMSWVSKRKTTRVEDMAYCLLGLFGINMPLLYGEGENAFLRLQREILAQSDDESIFAWTQSSPYSWSTQILAPSPVCFQNSGDVHPYTFVENRSSWTMTNQGLQMDLVLTPLPTPGWAKVLYADPAPLFFDTPLNCKRIGSSQPLGIRLTKGESGRYLRSGLIKYDPDSIRTNAERKLVVIPQTEKRSLGHASTVDISLSAHQTMSIREIRFSESAFIYDSYEEELHSFLDGWLQVPTGSLFEPGFVPANVLKGDQIARSTRLLCERESVAIVFEPKWHPQFGVIYGFSKYGAWVDIIPDICNPEIRSRLESYAPNPPRQIDRISNVIGPGLSINAILRRKGVQVPAIGPIHNTQFKRGFTNYELVLEAANGELRWPGSPDEDVPECSDEVSDSIMSAQPGGGS